MNIIAVLNKVKFNKVILIFLFSFLSFGLQAQKIKKEKFGYYNYFQPRATKVLDEFTYFSLEVEITDDDAYRRKLIENELEIEKFKAAGVDNKAQFIIKIIESPFKFKEPSKKSFLDKYKVNGVEKTRTKYYYEGTVSYHYILKVLDINNNELFREISKGVEKTKGESSESLITAMNQYVKDKYKSKDLAVKKVSEQLGDAFNNHFTDQKKAIHIKGLSIIEKQHSYEEFNTASKNLLRCYKFLNVNNNGSDETKKLLEESIILLNTFLKDSTPNDKKSRVNTKITAAAYYKLGLAFFMQKNYKEAKTNFEQAASFDKGVVAGILNWIYVAKTCAR